MNQVMLADGERQFQVSASEPAFDAVFRLRYALREKMNFGQDGLAREHFGRQSPTFLHRPTMVLIISVKHGDEIAGIDNDTLNRP